MTHAMYTVPAKAVAFLLAVILLTVFLGCVIAAVTSICLNLYTFSLEELKAEWAYLLEWEDIEGSQTYDLLQTLYRFRYPVIYAAAVSGLLSAALFIFLCCAVGRDREGMLALGPLEHIPFDIYLGLLFLAGGLIALVFFEQIYYEFRRMPLMLIVLTGVCLFVYALLISALITSLASRIKNRCLIRGTLCCMLLSLGWRIVKWFFRGLKKVFSVIRRTLSYLPVSWKAAISFCVYIFLYTLSIAILAASDGSFGAFVMTALLILLGVMTLTGIFYELKVLMRSGEALAEGHFEQKIQTHFFVGSFRRHAENLNGISDGMERALSERMKSESLKTELITNVSHDIKTPLTSIINYTDLLERSEIQDEAAREYIAVIKKQSAKLKKLTEDVIEASKASTGNIAVDLQPTDIAELMNQAAGEYGERFSDAGLSPVSNIPQEPVFIEADGRLMWRVLDNLFGNVCKYAQSGTRVYLSVECREGAVWIVLKNISCSQLNISADELMERFVRGDSARGGEGSGLGLSIARSLTELQKGEFCLEVDGDLFKTTLKFAHLSDEETLPVDAAWEK